MEVFPRIIITLTANVMAVLMAAYFVSDFQVAATIQGVMPIVLALSLVNLFLRPIIKVILSPLILISFGLFTILINAGILYTIDILSDSITINGLVALLYATLIISATNMIINHAALLLYRRPELA